MKKRFTCFLIVFLILVGLSAQSYQIETSRGPQTLKVPDGYTMEEAFLAVSKLYLEERFDHEDLITETEALVESVKIYVQKEEVLNEKNTELVEKYKSLASLHDGLLRLYRKETKTRAFIPIFSLGYSFDIEGGISRYQGSFGGVIFERISLQTMFSYPLGIGISIGVQF